MATPTDPPSATPSAPARSGPGCLLIGLLFVVVVLGGLVLGSVLNRPDEAEDESVTIDEGTIDGTAWRVDAVEDVQGDRCAFLYQDGEQLTGGCALTPQDATFGEQTVVFGKAETDAESVAVELDTGEVVDIETREVDGVDGRWYVQVVDGDVDAVDLADP
jgi:hypothetical protein